MKQRMYEDSKRGVSNVFVGCEFECSYCKTSFQRQMKRQMHNCMKCYTYEPHFHEERLKQSLPLTQGDEFIWLIRSGDPYFMEQEDFEKVLALIRSKPNRDFLIQTKHPEFLQKYYQSEFTDNMIIGTTIETNRDYKVSKAPTPKARWETMMEIFNVRLSITIEPIMDFDLKEMVHWMKYLKPERIYVGYDSGRNNLPEPSLQKTTYLIESLESLGLKVKTKLMREAV